MFWSREALGITLDSCGPGFRVECSEALCAGRRGEIELVVLVIEYWATHGLDQAVLRGQQPAASTHTWSLVFRVSDECSPSCSPGYGLWPVVWLVTIFSLQSVDRQTQTPSSPTLHTVVTPLSGLEDLLGDLCPSVSSITSHHRYQWDSWGCQRNVTALIVISPQNDCVHGNDYNIAIFYLST